MAQAEVQCAVWLVRWGWRTRGGVQLHVWLVETSLAPKTMGSCWGPFGVVAQSQLAAACPGEDTVGRGDASQQSLQVAGGHPGKAHWACLPQVLLLHPGVSGQNEFPATPSLPRMAPCQHLAGDVWLPHMVIS